MQADASLTDEGIAEDEEHGGGCVERRVEERQIGQRHGGSMRTTARSDTACDHQDPQDRQVDDRTEEEAPRIRDRARPRELDGEPEKE